MNWIKKFLIFIFVILLIMTFLWYVFMPREDELEVKFYLFTKYNLENGIELLNPTIVDKSPFNFTVSTRVIIHGYNGDISSPFNNVIRKAYLNRDEYNIISIDWSSESKQSYSHARRRINGVSLKLAWFLDYLISKNKIKLRTLYLIGHGIGAHIAGLAGRYMTSGRPNTIFGLDPAQYEFSEQSPSTRLNENDADYVETIHTAIGYYGFIAPIGTASFYPNWGAMQPGCQLDHYCWHIKSYQYFANTVENVAEYLAFKCKNFSNIMLRKTCNFENDNELVTMGGDPSNKGKAKGVYYVPVIF